MTTIDFSSIQQSYTPRLWTKAKEKLASSIIDIVEQNSDEIEVKLNNTNTVYIFSDGDWDCDCKGKRKACIHVAIVAHYLSGDEVKKMVSGHIGYRLIEEKNKGLRLKRVFVSNDREEPYTGQIGQKEIDLKIFKAFKKELGATFVVSREKNKKLLSLLSHENLDVMLNQEKIVASTKEAKPLCLLRKIEGGYRVQLVRDPRIKKVFSGGTVLYNNELRVFERTLDDLTYAQLLKGVDYSDAQVEQLVCEVIPNLKEKIPVLVKAKNLPKVKEEPIYVLIATDTLTNKKGINQFLSVKTSLVYGFPPVAEIKGKTIKQLQNVIPIRHKSKELELKEWFTSKREATYCSIGVTKEYPIDRIDDVIQALHKLSVFPQVQLTGIATKIEKKEVFVPSIDIQEDDLEVDWGGATTEEIFYAWKKKQTSVLLKNGTYQPLPIDWLNEYGHIVRELLKAKEENKNKHLPKFALFDLERLCEKLQKPPPPKLETLRALTHNFEGIPEVSLPTGLNAELREYQRVGYNWLSFLKNAEIGGILADDMGLGKTLQAICILEKKSLVVAPTSVLHNWINEGKKFRPDVTMCLYHGTHRVLDESADVILTSYAILRNDIEKLGKIEWNCVVLDEAQAIKNPKSHTANAAFSLKSKFRLTLTGTPIENRLNELWSQMNFLCPGLLAGNNDFMKTYEIPISQGSEEVSKKLQEKIKPFVLRRLKKDVTPELPSRTDMILSCRLSESERSIYDAVRVAAQEKIVKQLEEGTLSVMSALEALLRLRQAACHTGLLPGIEAETSSKIDMLVEKLEEVLNSGHKALVFSQWTSLLDRIEPHLRNKEMKFVRLDGATRNRSQVVEAFQKEDGVPIFLASLKAGGTGLNLTQADHVFLVDPWWNPAVEDQAADRAHRIGQDKPVIVYRLVAQDSVEERILQLQKRKRALAEAALGGTSHAATVTKEDLLALLQ